MASQPSRSADRGRRSQQHGGFALGLIVGLLIGVALSLAVALYVTKVPVPFIDKVPQRTAEQDAAEAEKNRNWDPNATFGGKSGRPAAPAAPAASAATPAVVAPPVVVPPVAPIVPPLAASAVKPAPAPATPAAPPAAASAAKSAKPATDAFQYFVQVGAYTRSEEAEQQRAKLAINGLLAKVSEREQAGSVMYRVRLGPFDAREDADRAKAQAAGVGYSDAALVRVAR